MLREDANAPRKQKHTAHRIHQCLAHRYNFDLVSYSTVYDYVLARRPQIEAEVLEGRRHLAGMVPRVHLPGEEAEVDFADVWDATVITSVSRKGRAAGTFKGTFAFQCAMRRSGVSPAEPGGDNWGRSAK